MSNTMNRRQFMLRSGALGGAVAAEVASLAANTTPAYGQAILKSVKVGKETPTVCPYCAVGCGQIVTVTGEGENRTIIDIQGNYDSPINVGTLCPKGAASYQLAVNPNRWSKVKYRAPYSPDWQELELETAMDMIAERFQKTRDENFIATSKIGDSEKRINQVLAINSLGGATIDDEWNYLHQKLMRACGVVSIENQARI